MSQVAGPTAALAGVPGGLQAQGLWIGRRQLFIRFAHEAETATMFTADALGHELNRYAKRSVFHSISVSGRDPLANLEFLQALFTRHEMPLPVLIDSDGQRPEALAAVVKKAALAQVTVEGAGIDAALERVGESLKVASDSGVAHALVLCPDAQSTDAQLLRTIENAHGVSESVAVVVHPPLGVPVERDRRWITFIERAAGLHSDVRLALRLPGPVGMR
jgi:organic radical activating enzyme